MCHSLEQVRHSQSPKTLRVFGEPPSTACRRQAHAGTLKQNGKIDKSDRTKQPPDDAKRRSPLNRLAIRLFARRKRYRRFCVFGGFACTVLSLSLSRVVSFR